MMFGFFFNRQKYSFKDIGLKCDVHTHILPGVDDGAADTATSVAILSAMYGAGVRKFFLTPHVSSGMYQNGPDSLRLAFDRLLPALPAELRNNITLRLASEYMIDEDFLDIEEKLTFSDNRILVEMSYIQRSMNLFEVIFQLQEDGYTPVLAHPERYVFYYGRKTPSALDELEKLKDMGCLFQLNVMSLTGAYGTGSLNNLKYFLDRDWYSYIATDIHSPLQFAAFSDFKVNASQFEKVRALAAANEELF